MTKLFISDCFSKNENGHLEIGGCDTVKLAGEFATPLYVMDENKIIDNCRRFSRSIDEFYDGNGLVTYASKAFSCMEICRLVNNEGMGLDVVSGGELYTALKAGFPPERIFFHGNNKTPNELTYAVSEKVGRIVVDNLFELEMLNGVAKSAGQKVKIQFRIKPGVEAHTHDFVKTGGIDSKFGLALETGEAENALSMAAKLEHIEVTGIHCHIGSQIFDIEPFTHTAKIMLGLLAKAKKIFGRELPELNLGGGFGVKYVDGQNPVPLEDYMRAVSVEVKAECGRLGIKTPFVIIEPGRSLVASSGATLYTVGSIKEIPGVRTYAIVDGGMPDNPRYALYKSEYDMLIANRAGEPKNRVYTVAGRCCESGDLLGENIPLPRLNSGDILAVLATGAYNYSMASNYNRLPKPAVVFVKDGKARCVVQRQSYDDLIKNDI